MVSVLRSVENKSLLSPHTECPGLAEFDPSTGMEVKNPLFSEETPAMKTEKAQAPTNKAANQK
jgi:hypothetical protein